MPLQVLIFKWKFWSHISRALNAHYRQSVIYDSACISRSDITYKFAEIPILLYTRSEFGIMTEQIKSGFYRIDNVLHSIIFVSFIFK